MASSMQQFSAPAAVSQPDASRSLQREASKQKLAYRMKRCISLSCPRVHGQGVSVMPVPSKGRYKWSVAASSSSPPNEAAIDGSSNAAASAASKLGVAPGNDVPKGSFPTAEETAISSLMTDVANLVKLVDSRDIVELELKHLDYELVIRKKEALNPPPTPNSAPSQPVVHTHYSTYASTASPSLPIPASATSGPPARALPPPAASPSVSHGSDIPRILSPMAGTFYKCPAPGEPPFVKVGDKVQKGQVICIVEAMKLMNEIEADKSGTIVDILAEDGKPVSVDMPLFSIKP
ncbi:hypothetical protein KP509_27G014400 [Ceratopteris richardii]|uniref:Biotin carboxyl carrier protein of acetyl-CoA carboxylase n=1 Tax=Ceratopteris richardii TaxID=49495 RepID=A0A8T2RG53_CERRI|nr:hypothetical protein KP509_27G014400 [Ceratopteris richardii]KAH7294707.1 hypothetical protein KP509_27G014400 [Ceratopteris richardii]